MTVIEFYRELTRGKGSCYDAVKNEPDRFNNVLMNAATRSTAFDMQCEGTRAGYIYELLSLTTGKNAYLAAAIKAFKESSPLHRSKTTPPAPDGDDEEPNFARNPAPTDDDFYFLAELLALFAKEGDHAALSALVREYDALFCHLRDRTERPDLFFPERDDFERLSILLTTSSLVDPLLALRDIGSLFENPIYKHYDFDQLHELVGIPNRERLKAQKDDLAVGRYLAIYYPAFSQNAAEGECQHEEDFEDLITEYLTEGPQARIERTHVPPHSRTGTIDPHALMAVIDKGDDSDAVEEAFVALSKIQHPDLHKWAIEHLESDPLHYLPILIKNYEENEDDAFEAWYELKQIAVDPDDENGWHHCHIALLSMEDEGKTPPPEALFHIYETTYCSNCRLKAIQQLHKAKLLTRKILTEALHDSCFETRALIKTILEESN